MESSASACAFVGTARDVDGIVPTPTAIGGNGSNKYVSPSNSSAIESYNFVQVGLKDIIESSKLLLERTLHNFCLFITCMLIKSFLQLGHLPQNIKTVLTTYTPWNIICHSCLNGISGTSS